MNISISEVIVVLLIALLVIKPEDMPGIAHKLGVVTRKIRHMIASFKKDMGDFIDITPDKNNERK